MRFMITDLICKLQQKFDYTFFVVRYMRTFGILLMFHVLESFFYLLCIELCSEGTDPVTDADVMYPGVPRL